MRCTGTVWKEDSFALEFSDQASLEDQLLGINVFAAEPSGQGTARTAAGPLRPNSSRYARARGAA